jgi:hypothetical protein
VDFFNFSPSFEKKQCILGALGSLTLITLSLFGKLSDSFDVQIALPPRKPTLPRMELYFWSLLFYLMFVFPNVCSFIQNENKFTFDKLLLPLSLSFVLETFLGTQISFYPTVFTHNLKRSANSYPQKPKNSPNRTLSLC